MFYSTPELVFYNSAKLLEGLHWNMKKGKRIGEIHLPVTNVTSCCVGGENMDMLFIKTAQTEQEFEPLAGGLFKVKTR